MLSIHKEINEEERVKQEKMLNYNKKLVIEVFYEWFIGLIIERTSSMLNNIEERQISHALKKIIRKLELQIMNQRNGLSLLRFGWFGLRIRIPYKS